MCGTTRMKEKKRKKRIKIKKKPTVRTDGHVKKRKPSTFLGEYYRILSSALRLSQKPFNSGSLLLLYFFHHVTSFSSLLFSMSWEVYKSPLSF
jgi:hypothetical protein